MNKTGCQATYRRSKDAARPIAGLTSASGPVRAWQHPPSERGVVTGARVAQRNGAEIGRLTSEALLGELPCSVIVTIRTSWGSGSWSGRSSALGGVGAAQKRLRGVECLADVGHQIVWILDAHGEADEGRRDVEL